MGISSIKQVVCSQRKMRLISVKVDGTGTASVSGTCSKNVTLTDNGTGDYTVTFNLPYIQIPEVVACPITASRICQLGTVAVGSVQVLTKNLSGSAADADFHLIVIGSDSADQI